MDASSSTRFLSLEFSVPDNSDRRILIDQDSHSGNVKATVKYRAKVINEISQENIQFSLSNDAPLRNFKNLSREQRAEILDILDKNPNDYTISDTINSGSTITVSTIGHEDRVVNKIISFAIVRKLQPSTSE